MRNVEIKARVDDLGALRREVAAISDSGPEAILQTDTFFNCSEGRLKLRVFADSTGELIFYRRADTKGPKESFYVRAPVSDTRSLGEALALAYGQMARIHKHRMLYRVGRTRIHLDTVDDLGHFLELEVVLRDDESSDAAMSEAAELMRVLGVQPNQLISGAYVDMLRERLSD